MKRYIIICTALFLNTFLYAQNDTLSYPLDNATGAEFYTAVGGGYASGTNTATLEVGNIYEYGVGKLTGLLVWFGAKQVVGTPDSINVNVYETGADSLPGGAPISTTPVSINDMDTSTVNFLLDYIPLNPVIVSGRFAITFEVGGIGVDDTIGIVTNSHTNGDGLGLKRSVVKDISFTWYRMGDFWVLGADPFDADLFILPIIEHITFPNPTSCGLGLNMLDGGCLSGDILSVPIMVSGVGGSNLGTDIELTDLDLIIRHGWDPDVDIYLESPNGVLVEISTDNSVSGANYGDPTDITCTAVTNFNMNAATAITAGTDPYIGSFVPEGNFSDFNDGSDPNGVWLLHICDDDPIVDLGTLEYASLSFAAPMVCTPPTPTGNAGFTPSYNSLPCVEQGTAYNEVINFESPSTIPSPLGSVPVNWVRIDSIVNLPCNLTWETAPGDSIGGGETMCIVISGTTNDDPGQYDWGLYITVQVTVFGIPQTVQGSLEDLFSGNVPPELIYYIRVQKPAGPCAPADTLLGTKLACQPCPDPVTLTATNVTAFDADLNWDSFNPGVDYLLEYGPAGFTPGTGTVFLGTSVAGTNTVSLSDVLTSSTTYDFYVQEDCSAGGNFSSNVGPFTFSTLPEAPNDSCIHAIPIVCGTTLIDSTTWASDHDAPGLCGFENFSNTPGLWYIFSGNGDSVILSTCNGGSVIDTKIGVFEGPCGSLNCVVSDDDDFSCSNISFTTVGFNSHLGTDYYIYVSGYDLSQRGDFELSVTCITPCINPDSLKTSNITTSDVDLEWISSNPGATFFVEYGLAGFTPGTGTMVSGTVPVDGPPVHLSGLSFSSAYEWYVMEDCGLLSSVQVGPDLFMTADPPCDDPINLDTANVSSDSVDVIWTSANPGADFTVEYGPTGFTPGTGTFIMGTVGVNGPPVSINGLTPNTSYDWYVTEDCGANSSNSIGPDAFTTTTPPCEDPTNPGSTNITSGGASAGWTSSNPGAAFMVEYGPAGFTPGTGNTLTGTVGVDGPPVSIAGLSPNTSYDWYVIENCGLSSSSNVGPQTFTTTPANDICSGAIPISCGDVIIDSTTLASLTDAPADCGGVGLNTSGGVWFVYSGTGIDITLTTCNPTTDFDTKIGVFEGPCLALNCVTGNDDQAGLFDPACNSAALGTNSASTLTFTSEIGKDYYIYVTGFGSAGVFELSVDCSASIVINEVDYDQPGTDFHEFIELKNTGATSLNLDAVQVLLINGNLGGTTPYQTIDLPDSILAAGDYFVICGDKDSVSNCDFVVSPASDFIQNGAPDAIALMLNGNLLDVVSYEGDAGAPYFETTGVGLIDDPAFDHSGISRYPDGTDTDDNAADFSQRCVTPGLANVSQNSNCTVPNDSCAFATVITPALGIPFDNSGATTDGAPDALCDTFSNNQIFLDVWYRYDAPCNGTAVITTVGGTTVDTRIAVYDGSCSGPVIVCNDDYDFNVNSDTTQSLVSWSLVSGTTYFIRIGGNTILDFGSGTFDFTVTDVVPPTITCAPDQVKSTDPGVCTGTVAVIPPTVSDDCGSATFVNDSTGTANATISYALGLNTLIWTATDASGNTATCTQNITVNDTEVPSITCAADQTQTADPGVCNAAVTVTGPSTSDNCSVASMTNDFTFTANASGTYPVGTTNVVWSVTDGGGNTSTCLQIITVTDDEYPSLTCPTDTVIALCDSTITLPLPITGDNCGVASIVNDSTGNSGSTITFALGVNVLTWTVTDNNGNTSTCAMNVTRNEPPAVNITPDPAETCAAVELKLYGNGVPGSGAITSRSWTGLGLISPFTNDSVKFNIGVDGNFSPITYTVADVNGCTSSDNISVTVFPNPVANIIPDVVEICEGELYSLNANPTGGTGGLISHSWIGDTGPLSSTTIPNPTFAGSTPGTYHLVYTVTDGKGCMGSDNVTVIVNPNPLPVISGTNSVCENQSGVVYSTPNVSGHNYSWTISGGTITSGAGTSNIVVKWGTAGFGTLNLTESVPTTGCSTAATPYSVTINPNPTPFITGDHTVCEGESAIYSTPNIGGHNFSWTVTGGTISSGGGTNSITVDWGSAGLGAVRLIETDAGTGCFTRTPVFSVTIYPNPTPVISGDHSVCENEAGVGYSTTNVGGHSYSWVVTGGTVTSGAGTSHISVTWGASGGGMVTLTETANATGCATTTGSYNVVINPTPLASAFPDTAICKGASVTLSATGGGSYIWSNGQTASSISVTPLATTIYTVTVTDGNGCTASDNVTVTVNPNPTASAGPDKTVCSGNSVTLTATGGPNYLWSPGGETTASITVSPVSNTTYSVIVTNGSGCSASDDAVVTVNVLPVPSAGSDTAVCAGESVTLSASGGVSYKWSNGAMSALTPVAPLTTTTYTVTVTGVNGCTASDDEIVDVKPVPTVNAGPDTSVCKGSSTILTASGGGNYLWSNGETSSSTKVTPVITTTYTVTVTGSNGCKNTGNATVQVLTQPVGNYLASHTCLGDTTFFTDLSVGLDGGTMYLIDFYNDGSIDLQLPPGDTAFVIQVARTIPFRGIVLNGNGCSDTLIGALTVDTVPAVTFSGLDANYCMDSSSNILTGVPAGGRFTGDGISGHTFVPFYADTGKHDIIYKYTDGNGCSAVDTQTTEVHPLPSASILNLANTYCSEDSPVTLSAMPPGGTFSGSGITDSTFDPPSVVFGVPFVISYSYTDSNGCKDNDSKIVTVYPNPTPVIHSFPDPFCLDDEPLKPSASPLGGTFSINGGTLDTLYFDALGVGSYQLDYTYTDLQGCEGAASRNFVVNALPMVTFAPLDPRYCVNDPSVTMVATPPHGQFSGPGVVGNVFDPAIPGNGGPYTVTYEYTDSNGCSDTQSQSLIVLNSPFVKILLTDPVYCYSASPDTIPTIPAGGNFIGPGMDGDVFTPKKAGVGTHVITYEFTNFNGCKGIDKISITVEYCPGVGDISMASEIDIYPNPTTGAFNIEFNGDFDKQTELVIYNLEGREVYQDVIVNAGKHFVKEIDLSAQPTGMYYVRLRSKSGTLVKKLMKE